MSLSGLLKSCAGINDRPGINLGMKICPQCGTHYDGEQSICPQDGEVLRDDHAEMIGRVLDGQYEIEEFIGEGGMGAVYRARHTMLGDQVAIKLLPPEMRRNTEWVKRFQREGQAARRFHHPNAVIVHDMRTSSEGEVYLVMEYVKGRTLDDEVAARGGQLSLTEALKIIEPVASVLDAAHAMGVVHRDLKPSNIMITERGVVKLLDLGVAKLTDMAAGAARLTMTGQLVGTPYFMSPEQWGELPRDGSEEIDGRTDVYSLGVVIYQITTGEFPFKGNSFVTLRRAHCHETPRPLEEINASIPHAWSRAVLRAMSKDRGDRQATAGEFARELRAALNGVEMPQRETLSAQPTLITHQQGTSPGVHATPRNLTASTPDAQGGADIAQQTAAPQFPSASWPQAKPKSSSRMLVIIAVAAVLLLAVGGFALWKWRAGNKPDEKQNTIQQKQPPLKQRTAENEASNSSEPVAPATTAESDKPTATDGAFMLYHLLVSQSPLDEGKRLSGRDAIEPGTNLQFAFTPSESGYLYMLGHDNSGNPVIMPLGDVAAVAEVTGGEEKDAPSLARVKVNDKPGTELFTIIFSDKPLDLPFASGMLPVDGSLRKLTADEKRRIEELRQRSAPVTIEFTGEKENQTAVVRLTGERGSKPIMFDIKLQLQRR
ncbi:MAG: eukaryotic-like serine/threonine-protein kinase [Acidobacteriota bacterium]|jgi:serine/threonine-protein kinase|nr:eukaryotic-like serine/threonine-protein kinase [Acidobacteriota bacterium]